MKRFIDLRGQIWDNDAFAFYDTIIDQFEVFNGDCTWTSKQEFIDSYEGGQLERYLALMPEWVLQDNDPTRWCSGCGARTRKECGCGEIADND